MALMVVSLFVFALLLLLGALWALREGDRAAIRTQVGQRFQDVPTLRIDGSAGPRSLKGSLTERWLWRAGIRLKKKHVIGLLLTLALSCLLAWHYGGLLSVSIVIGGMTAGTLAWPHYQYRKRSVAMIAQLPLFLDQVERGLATGRNLDGALNLATQETREPLKEVMSRIQQAVALGEDIGEALRDAARLYELRELHFVAMAVQVSRGYGSSPKEMLESVAKLIRQREQAQRELAALTGEIKISAWVLSILPSALALYMVTINPDYINGMWHDPTGRVILLFALALQAIGALILWRMVKSV